MTNLPVHGKALVVLHQEPKIIKSTNFEESHRNFFNVLMENREIADTLFFTNDT